MVGDAGRLGQDEQEKENKGRILGPLENYKG